jgi:hypothetical protein
VISTSGGSGGYVAEKAEVEKGWLFPVGDEVHALGYDHMFMDMFDAMDNGRQPMETFYDGYVVNAVIDACYRSASSRKWEPVALDLWRAAETTPRIRARAAEINGHVLIKEEHMPDGTVKRILKDKESGEIRETIVEGG